MGKTKRVATDGAERQTIRESLRRFYGRRLFWIVLVVAGLSFAQFQFWKQPSLGDRANWDYFAQVISRGGVPYRDVVNIKSPIAAYIGAAAILVAQPVGLRDIIAIRITYLLLAALTVALTFLVTLEYSNNVRLAVLAGTAMLMFDAFARFNSGGVQPKTAMIVFGLLSLWAILKDRPFAAGVFGMLSALSWQPGLLFAGAAGLAASRYLTSWRDRRAVKVIAGAAVPLAIMLAYFWVTGALKDFYLWNFNYTTMVYAPRESRPLGDFFSHLNDMINKPYRHASWLFYLAIAGLVLALWQHARRTPERKPWYDDAPRHAVIIAGLVYFAFCMIDIQGPVDLIPLLPFVAIFAAVAMDYAIGKLVYLSARVGLKTNPALVTQLVTALLIAIMLFQSALTALQFEHPFPLLTDQDSIVAEIVAQLQPGDEIFTHGVTELLVLGRLTNASKYFLLDRGKDAYLDVVEQGGFAGWFERLKAERPRIIALGRFEEMDHEKDFRAWAAADYVPRTNRVLTYYVRKDDGR
jgi:hypothetical protein